MITAAFVQHLIDTGGRHGHGADPLMVELAKQCQRIASMLGCMVESSQAGHADECRRTLDHRPDPANCILCRTQQDADELLTSIGVE